MTAGPLTQEQRAVLEAVKAATRANTWYQAATRGEHVILATLYRIGLVTRRKAGRSYEYRTY